MSNSNQSHTPEVDDLLESLIGLYVNSPNVSPPERNNPARDNRYPLSFNLQQPRQSLFSRTSPTTPNYSGQNMPSQQQTRNQQHSIYLSIIQTIRDIGAQYNNNMREYNTNVRQLLNILNEVHRDIRTLNTMNEEPTERPINQVPRPEASRFHDGIFTQRSGSNIRPNQNMSYNTTPIQRQPSNNIFDVLLQAIPLTSNMENVVVRPSEEQIRNATRSIIYSSNNTRIRNNTCPITLEPFEEQQMLTQITYCGHVFSQEGINRWFEGNVRCPICSYDIRNYNARCRQCRRPLEEYGTRCTYCEEAGNTAEREDMETEDNEEPEQVPETNNEDSSDSEDTPNQPSDTSLNPYQVILNYEIRAPDFVFNSTDMSFNVGV